MYLLKLVSSNVNDLNLLMDIASKIKRGGVLWDEVMIHPTSFSKVSPQRKHLLQPENPVLDVRDISFFYENRIHTFTMIFDVVNSEEPPEKLMFDLTLKGFSVELYHLSKDLLYFYFSNITPSTEYVLTERTRIREFYGSDPNHIEGLGCVPFTYPAPELSESENKALLGLLMAVQN